MNDFWLINGNMASNQTWISKMGRMNSNAHVEATATKILVKSNRTVAEAVIWMFIFEISGLAKHQLTSKAACYAQKAGLSQNRQANQASWLTMAFGADELVELWKKTTFILNFWFCSWAITYFGQIFQAQTWTLSGQHLSYNLESVMRCRLRFVHNLFDYKVEYCLVVGACQRVDEFV